MSESSPVYVANRRDVAHESFDDEVILIHFPSGKYFRLNAPGRVAWAVLANGATAAEIAAALSGAFEVGGPASRASADALVASLVAQGLVVQDVADRRSAATVAQPSGVRAPFEEPRLEIFTDLEQLFLVDPIHDVDASGWPHAKA